MEHAGVQHRKPLLGCRAQTLHPSGRVFAGEMLFGWGGFNLVEGAIDHHWLEIHHVRDLPVHTPLYDWIFLVVGGIGLLVLGWTLMQPTGRRASDRSLQH